MNDPHLLVNYFIERCQKLCRKDVATLTNYDTPKDGHKYAFMRVLTSSISDYLDRLFNRVV
jgi:hypothetical protein